MIDEKGTPSLTIGRWLLRARLYNQSLRHNAVAHSNGRTKHVTLGLPASSSLGTKMPRSAYSCFTLKTEHESMNRTSDKAVGVANETIGKAQQGIGNAVGSDKGAAQEVKGDAQKAVGDARNATKKAVDNTADALKKPLVEDVYLRQ
jgi:uncharacterized protein YjbJ (UPF0337 family)